MSLNGADAAKIHQALLSAFGSTEQLAKMVRFGLNERLEQIVPVLHEDLSTVIFYLIEWADEHDQVENLLSAAVKFNPSNVKLTSLAQEHGLNAEAPPHSRDDPNKIRRVFTWLGFIAIVLAFLIFLSGLWTKQNSNITSVSTVVPANTSPTKAAFITETTTIEAQGMPQPTIVVTSATSSTTNTNPTFTVSPATIIPDSPQSTASNALIASVTPFISGIVKGVGSQRGIKLNLQQGLVVFRVDSQSQSSFFSNLIDQNGDLVTGSTINGIGPFKGSSYALAIQLAGTYSLNVETSEKNNWHIEIEQPNSAANTIAFPYIMKGQGSQVSPLVKLVPGMISFSISEKTIGSGSFNVWLLDEYGAPFRFLVSSEPSNYNGVISINLKESKNCIIAVQAVGITSWNITLNNSPSIPDDTTASVIAVTGKSLLTPIARGESSKQIQLSLKMGLNVFHMSYISSNISSYSATLLDTEGNHLDDLAVVDEVRQFYGSKAVYIENSGTYTIEIISVGEWTITPEQITASTDALTAPVRFTGQDQQSLPPIKLDGGFYKLSVLHKGSGNIIIDLVDINGDQGKHENPLNEEGYYNGVQTLHVHNSGVYVPNIIADGTWSITVAKMDDNK